MKKIRFFHTNLIIVHVTNMCTTKDRDSLNFCPSHSLSLCSLLLLFLSLSFLPNLTYIIRKVYLVCLQSRDFPLTRDTSGVVYFALHLLEVYPELFLRLRYITEKHLVYNLLVVNADEANTILNCHTEHFLYSRSFYDHIAYSVTNNIILKGHDFM